MIQIKTFEELENFEITIKQRFRITKSKKEFAVFVHDKLYLVNDLERLFFDRLRSENIYQAQVYQLR